MPCSRREFLALSSSLTFGTSARRPFPVVSIEASESRNDVAWLAEVLQPPQAVSSPSRPLAQLLVDENRRAITTATRWLQRRTRLERNWQRLLGSIDVSRARPPSVDVVGEEIVEEVVRQRVRYDSEPGVPTEAYILKPRTAKGLRPGAIVFHSTFPESIRQPAGLADVPEKHFGLALARRGFVTFCPRNFLWPETARMAADEETRAFRTRHPRARGMAKMLFDGQVALDILAAQPGVDPKRLGCIGHSLGAKEALYLAAFDRRIRATVSSEGGIGTTMSNWNAEWYLGHGGSAFEREHHELLALAAPRPFLLVGGDSADGAASWPYVAAAQSVYRLYNEPPRLGLLNHRKGHAVPPEVVPRLLEWLETYV